MRKGNYWVLAPGLALVVVGCNPPAPIAYSPQGDRLAYFAKDQLRIRDAAGSESVVSYRPVMNLSWSDDGAKLAYTTETDGGKDRQGHPLPGHTSVWVYDLAKQSTAQADNLTSPLCWFKGDLLAADEREHHSRIATVDANSGQVRYEADAPMPFGELLPSPATGDVLVTGADQCYRFNGQDFQKGPNCPSDGLAIPGGQPVFADTKALVGTKFMPVVRHLDCFTWDGNAFQPLTTPTVPSYVDADHKVVITSIPIAISSGAGRYVVTALAVKGTPKQDKEIEGLVKAMEKHPTRANSDRLNSDHPKMKQVLVLLAWSRTSGWRVIREEVMTKKGLPQKSVPLFDQVAIKPDGSSIAWVDSSDGVQTIDLP